MATLSSASSNPALHESSSLPSAERASSSAGETRQISPRVLHQVGPDDIIIVVARTKVEALNPRRLLVDTGDEKLDQAFRGYRRVLTGYREEIVVKRA